MTRRRTRISRGEARRLAIGAQGLGEERPAEPVSGRAVQAVVRRLGLLQIDSVNVLTRMHYLPLFSRLGAYERALLDASAWGERRQRTLFEYWAHEASLLPLNAHPLLRWRMERADRGLGVWGRLKPFALERRGEALAILKRIQDDGPMAASDLSAVRGSGGWWGWSDAKSALEWLFWTGRLTTRARRNGFEREYDISERVIPPEILASPTPTPAQAHRALLAQASRALGVASMRELRDYYRLSREDAGPRVLELVEEGALIPVEVEGWRRSAYIHRDASIPRAAKAWALLAPFDPLIWERSRTEALFGFRYRIEIYTPAHRREHGYYVLPFLMGDALAARVDLKADRPARRLLVQAAHLEPGGDEDAIAGLAGELRLMARWLDLDAVCVKPVGDAAEALNAALHP